MKQVALAFPFGVSHLERVAYGIRRYARQQNNWYLITNPEKHQLELKDLQNWQGDGIIGFINSQRDIDIILKKNMPIVNISGALSISPFPRVRTDYYQTGVMAAEHFISRGFVHFAFYGLEDLWFAGEMGRGYIDTVTKNNSNVHTYIAKSALKSSWAETNSSLETWIEQLPKPCALLASHDPRAIEIIQTCRRLNFNVPGDIAVLGSNNDITTCEFCDPQLSSISRNGDEIGYQAAELLDRMLRGETVPNLDVVIQPSKLVERQSTEHYAVRDPELKRAVDYILQNYNQQINVNSICAHICRSRRWLEYAFKVEMKMTPLEFITNAKVRKAVDLIKDSEKIKLGTVAQMCGFSSSDIMNKAIFKRYGQNAQSFRR